MNEEIIRWFMRRIDELEAQVDLLSQSQHKHQIAGKPKRSFSEAGHKQTTHDKCEKCGLTGQAFDYAKTHKAEVIECPFPS